MIIIIPALTLPCNGFRAETKPALCTRLLHSVGQVYCGGSLAVQGPVYIFLMESSRSTIVVIMRMLHLVEMRGWVLLQSNDWERAQPLFI